MWIAPPCQGRDVVQPRVRSEAAQREMVTLFGEVPLTPVASSACRRRPRGGVVLGAVAITVVLAVAALALGSAISVRRVRKSMSANAVTLEEHAALKAVVPPEAAQHRTAQALRARATKASHGSEASINTALLAKLEAMDSHELPTQCLQVGFQYEPLDMVGQDGSAVALPVDCQARCRSVKGCAHFSLSANGGCHLQDEAAKIRRNSKSLAGPRKCGAASLSLPVEVLDEAATAPSVVQGAAPLSGTQEVTTFDIKMIVADLSSFGVDAFQKGLVAAFGGEVYDIRIVDVKVTVQVHVLFDLSVTIDQAFEAVSQANDIDIDNIVMMDTERLVALHYGSAQELSGKKRSVYAVAMSTQGLAKALSVKQTAASPKALKEALTKLHLTADEPVVSGPVSAQMEVQLAIAAPVEAPVQLPSVGALKAAVETHLRTSVSLEVVESQKKEEGKSPTLPPATGTGAAAVNTTAEVLPKPSADAASSTASNSSPSMEGSAPDTMTALQSISDALAKINVVNGTLAIPQMQAIAGAVGKAEGDADGGPSEPDAASQDSGKPDTIIMVRARPTNAELAQQFLSPSERDDKGF